MAKGKMSSIKKTIRQEIERQKVDYLNRSYTFVPVAMEQLLDFIDSLPEESENHGCGVEFPHFGANYPDAKCIDGYLWDMDSYEDGVYTIGGDDPCPICNTEKWLKDVLDDEIFKTRDEALEYVKMLKSKYKHKDSLPEEEPSKDLEEAAADYADKHGFRVPYDGSNNYYDDVDVRASKEGFIAGAKWHKEQMMKEAVDYKICNNLAAYPVIYYEVDHLGLKYGDKVKLIIVKDND